MSLVRVDVHVTDADVAKSRAPRFSVTLVFEQCGHGGMSGLEIFRDPSGASVVRVRRLLPLILLLLRYRAC